MDIAARLIKIREHADLNQKDMADFLQISYRSWQDYELGKSMPGGRVFERLANLRYNINWVLTGAGAMRLDAWDVCESHHRYESSEDMGNDYVLVPRYEVQVSAGGGAFVDSEQIVDHLAFRSDWVRNVMRLNPGDLFLVNTVGDSMYPTIKEGDLLLVDKGQREVKADAIYVLVNDGMLVAKRLHKLYDGSVQIKSDNKIYDTQLVPFDRVNVLNIIGRVVWGGGRM